MEPFLRALKEEMTLRRAYVTAPDTLYIGGGTPSLCPAKELGGLIKKANETWGFHFEEITVELNPEDVTADYCRTLADYGVNRLSIGVQSFFDEHLYFMNRRHNAIQGIQAVEAARRAGFQNINIDLIFGFHALLMSQWRETIRQALSLFPEHISAYQLSMDVGSQFFYDSKKGLFHPFDPDEAAAQYALLQEMTQIAGLKQYELSNFAKEGYRSKHNSAYWQDIPYLGLGPSAHSYNGAARHANIRHLGRYLHGIAAKHPIIKRESTTPKKRYNEWVMTRLRTIEGIRGEEIEHKFSDPLFARRFGRHFRERSTHLLRQGLLIEQEGALKIAPKKLFVSDGIIVEMMV